MREMIRADGTKPAKPLQWVPEAQFEKLVEVISRSQSDYRELIDNLDQAVFTLSHDGEVRVANRHLADLRRRF